MLSAQQLNDSTHPHDRPTQKEDPALRHSSPPSSRTWSGEVAECIVGCYEATAAAQRHPGESTPFECSRGEKRAVTPLRGKENSSCGAPTMAITPSMYSMTPTREERRALFRQTTPLKAASTPTKRSIDVPSPGSFVTPPRQQYSPDDSLKKRSRRRYHGSPKPCTPQMAALLGLGGDAVEVELNDIFKNPSLEGIRTGLERWMSMKASEVANKARFMQVTMAMILLKKSVAHLHNSNVSMLLLRWRAESYRYISTRCPHYGAQSEVSKRAIELAHVVAAERSQGVVSRDKAQLQLEAERAAKEEAQAARKEAERDRQVVEAELVATQSQLQSARAAKAARRGFQDLEERARNSSRSGWGFCFSCFTWFVSFAIISIGMACGVLRHMRDAPKLS